MIQLVDDEKRHKFLLNSGAGLVTYIPLLGIGLVGYRAGKNWGSVVLAAIRQKADSHLIA